MCYCVYMLIISIPKNNNKVQNEIIDIHRFYHLEIDIVKIVMSAFSDVRKKCP